jgi:hypothetical protein
VRNIRDQVSEIGMDPRCCDLFPNVPRLYQMSSQVEIESSCLADPFISFYIPFQIYPTFVILGRGTTPRQVKRPWNDRFDC